MHRPLALVSTVALATMGACSTPPTPTTSSASPTSTAQASSEPMAASATAAVASPRASAVQRKPRSKYFLAEPTCRCSPNDILCQASCSLDAEVCGCPDRQVDCLLDCLKRAETED